MTITMPDSIVPANMPKGYAAYLAYVDGARSKDADEVRVMFAGAEILTLTVTGSTLDASGIDCERGDADAVAAADWVRRKLAADPGSRPVVYASVQGEFGYGMPWVIAELVKLGITRAKWRALTAHYGWKIGAASAHICGPSTCGAPFQADGTQWTSTFPGVGGADIDMSLLDDGFFGDWVFGRVRGLTAKRGRTSVSLAWSAPGQVEPEAVHHYQVTVRRDGQDVPSYPRDVPKLGNPQVWQGGSLPSATALEALVRAVAKDGHASPWASVKFTTG